MKLIKLLSVSALILLVIFYGCKKQPKSKAVDNTPLVGVESYKLGANSYVVKPVDIAQFIEAIKVLGQYWAVINQPPPARTV